jgi:hypothetical protein
MPEPEEPMAAPVGGLVVAFPVSWDMDFLPYFPAHRAFIEHASTIPATDDAPAREGCERCHVAAFHPDELPEDEDPEELFCETGRELREEVRVSIAAQHAASLQN